MDVMVFNPPHPTLFFPTPLPPKKNTTDRRLQRPVLSEEHNAAFPGFLQYIALASVWLCVSAPAAAACTALTNSLRPAESLHRRRQPGGGQGTV